MAQSSNLTLEVKDSSSEVQIDIDSESVYKLSETEIMKINLEGFDKLHLIESNSNSGVQINGNRLMTVTFDDEFKGFCALNNNQEVVIDGFDTISSEGSYSIQKNELNNYNVSYSSNNQILVGLKDSIFNFIKTDNYED